MVLNYILETSIFGHISYRVYFQTFRATMTHFIFRPILLFFFKASGAYDMAILVLHAKMRFSPNVRPICLPTKGIVDEDREAFTAGYGLRYVSEKKEREVFKDRPKSSCLTNEIGPITFNHCQGGVVRLAGIITASQLPSERFTRQKSSSSFILIRWLDKL